MNIAKIADELNEMASKFQMANFQATRIKLKHLNGIYTHKIFSKKGIHEGYAFHSGGRTELQYNIGYEEESKIFRYGVAFSLEPSQSLPDPISTFKPKIERYNEFIEKKRSNYQDMFLWYYQNGKRSKNLKVGTIDHSLIQSDAFIFVGKYFKKEPDKLDKNNYKEILTTFDKLLELYKYVETEAAKEKIARVCWNDYGWKKPSGRDGKSKNVDSFEYDTGYGHEEWLLDIGKIINGFHYGFLQPISKHRAKYDGNIFNISLYSINSKTNERWWLGKIKNIHIISEIESKRMYFEYKKKGWIKEMTSQLKSVGANPKEFVGLSPSIFFNLKFKPEDLELLESPLRFPKTDSAISATYYSTLLNKELDPRLEATFDNAFIFVAGHSKRKMQTRAKYESREKEVDLLHNQMQENTYNQLVKIYGKNNVGTENAGVDLVIKDKGAFIFYEFKTTNSIKGCIREALAQLLEYAYYPNENRASKLVIVSQNEVNQNAQKYLERLRKDFKVPVYYRQYRLDTNEIQESEY